MSSLTYHMRTDTFETQRVVGSPEKSKPSNFTISSLDQLLTDIRNSFTGTEVITCSDQ